MCPNNIYTNITNIHHSIILLHQLIKMAFLLTGLKLTQYTKAFNDYGVEGANDIVAMSIDDLMTEFDMKKGHAKRLLKACLLYTSPSPRD